MAEGNLFNEKRQHPRVPVKIPIKFKALEDQQQIKSLLERPRKDFPAQTVDISLGGVYMVCDQPLKTGQLLKVDLELDGGKKNLTAFAEVVWSNETGGGLRFLSMKDEDMEALKARLNNHR